MDLYILRHGIAEEAAVGSRDSDRALTSEGRKKLRQVLGTAHAAGVRPSLILTSPYRRAVQTAHIAAEVLNYKGDILETPSLEPGSSPESVWEEVRTHKQESGLLLAGHEPLFSRLTGYLLGCSSLKVDFKKGAVACIEIDRFPPEPHGTLRWMLIPKLAAAD